MVCHLAATTHLHSMHKRAGTHSCICTPHPLQACQVCLPLHALLPHGELRPPSCTPQLTPAPVPPFTAAPPPSLHHQVRRAVHHPVRRLDGWPGRICRRRVLGSRVSGRLGAAAADLCMIISGSDRGEGRLRHGSLAQEHRRPSWAAAAAPAAPTAAATQATQAKWLLQCCIPAVSVCTACVERTQRFQLLRLQQPPTKAPTPLTLLPSPSS